jgi:hypothetical protein
VRPLARLAAPAVVAAVLLALPAGAGAQVLVHYPGRSATFRVRVR